MQRVNRHTGEVKKDMVVAGATASDPEAEHKVLGIETRVLVAAGLLGVLTYGMFAYDPVPRKPRPKTSGGTFLDEPGRSKGFSRRKMEEDIEAEVEAAEAEIDDEFEHTDLEDESDEEDEEDEE